MKSMRNLMKTSMNFILLLAITISFLSCGELQDPFIHEAFRDDDIFETTNLFAGRYDLLRIQAGDTNLTGPNWGGSLVLQNTLYGIWTLRLEVYDPAHQTELEFSGADWFAFDLDDGRYWVDLEGICDNAIARWGTQYPKAMYLTISTASADGLLKDFLETLDLGDTYTFVWWKEH